MMGFSFGEIKMDNVIQITQAFQIIPITYLKLLIHSFTIFNMSINKALLASVFLLFVLNTSNAQQTYAEKLGFPKGAKVLILHVDDGGMSLDSNEGVIQAMEKGVANSVSVMMPCPWVPGFIHYLKQHPEVYLSPVKEPHFFSSDIEG